MGVLLAPIRVLKVINDALLALGKGVAALALAIMVIFILAQVFFRYVLNNALPWPDEAARFMMLWMTGLAAPAAYRFGGFVAIDMLERALGRTASAILSLFLFSVSLIVMIYAVQIAWAEVTGFSGSFKTASLYTFFEIGLKGGFSVEFGITKMPRSQMMASLLVGLVLLIVVNIELVLRLIVTLGGGEAQLPALAGTKVEAD